MYDSTLLNLLAVGCLHNAHRSPAGKDFGHVAGVARIEVLDDKHGRGQVRRERAQYAG